MPAPLTLGASVYDHMSKVDRVADQTPQILARREDEFSWLAKIRSPQTGRPMELAFPKSVTFIRPLPRPQVNRLVKHGWSEPKTVFLESLYLFTFFPFLPAQAGAWIIDVQDKRVFFKGVAFRRSYVSDAERIELEDTVLHEVDHLREYLPKSRGGGMPVETGHGEEAYRIQAEHEHSERDSTKDALIKRYGPSKVAKSLAGGEAVAMRELERRPVLAGIIMEVWMGRFFAKNAESLKEFAEDLPATMQGGRWAESWNEVADGASRLYKQFVERDLPVDV